MKRRILASFILSALTFSPVFAETPTTQPAKDINEVLPLIQAAGGIYTSIKTAVEKNDLDTATTLASDLLEQSDMIMAKLKGSVIEGPASMGFKQVKRLHEALVAKDVEKAKTIIAGLDQIGEGIGQAIDKLLEAPTTQPKDK